MYDFVYYEAGDVMTRDPVTLGPESVLGDAEKIFSVHDFNGLPVVDEEGRLLGLLTKLDLLAAFRFTPDRIIPPYEEIMARPVRTVMNTSPRSLTPETPLTRVLRLMLETRFKSFPVISEDKLVGMTAREDVLRALGRAAAGLRPERMGDQPAGSTLTTTKVTSSS